MKKLKLKLHGNCRNGNTATRKGVKRVGGVYFDPRATMAALYELAGKANRGARAGAEAMAAVGESAIKRQLSLSSHPAGTRTPAAPGSPPSLISGQLRRSVRRTGLASKSLGRWESRVAPTTVYARIQELGGHAGRHHASYLPPRPYVAPAMIESRERARKAAIGAFRAETGL